MSERVLEFEEALAEVLRHARAVSTPPCERVPLELLDASGRVLATGVFAERDQPPFARSTRDGYAVRAADVTAQRALRLLGSVRAGEQWSGNALHEGEAVEIMTGAPLPQGADAVLMLEHAEMNAGLVRAMTGRMLATGENVVPQGAEARQGAEVIPAGRRFGAAEIAMAASCGCARLEVFDRPVVEIVATGDELVDLNAVPERWQIRNSNSYSLAAMVQNEGGVPTGPHTARDTHGDLVKFIAKGSVAGLLVLSGGVSMGKYDLVEQVLREFDAEFFFTGAWIQPGKPVVFGRIPAIGAYETGSDGTLLAGPVPRTWAGKWTYFFGLPGNPVSTEVCFRLFVAPMLRALCGQTEIAPRFVEARLTEDVMGGARVTRFLPAVVQSDWKHVSARVVPWQGSGDLAASARANGFVVLPNGVEKFAAGESVRVLLR